LFVIKSSIIAAPADKTLYETKDFLGFLFLTNCCVFYAEKRDIYLAFKALNSSGTGHLNEEEFMDVYSVTRLRWTVSYDNKCLNIVITQLS